MPEGLAPLIYDMNLKYILYTYFMQINMMY